METTDKPQQGPQYFRIVEKKIGTIKAHGYKLTWVEYHYPKQFDKVEFCIRIEDAQGNVKKLFV